MKTKNEISDELSSCVQDDEDSSHNLLAYAGPVAQQIVRLEERILALEKSEPMTVYAVKEEVPSKIQAGPVSIDTRAGLSVADVVDLARALRDPK